MSTSKMSSSKTESPSTVPYRQIRAHLPTPTTITVYQAYAPGIALPAVANQCLLASPLFGSRMTWIKPSWSWMLYRSGYSYKDARQAHVLAIEMTREGFERLLRAATLSHGGQKAGEEAKDVTPVVQWDPERTVRLEKLGYRSLQLGVPRGLVERWAREDTVAIRDVTEQARELKRVLDEEGDVGLEELVRRGLVPVEEVYEVEEDIIERLQMRSPDE